jgi:hypothetical protein
VRNVPREDVGFRGRPLCLSMSTAVATPLSEAGAWASRVWMDHRGLPPRESPIAGTLVTPLPLLSGAGGELCAHAAAWLGIHAWGRASISDRYRARIPFMPFAVRGARLDQTLCYSVSSWRHPP